MSEAGDSLRQLIVAYEGGTMSVTDFCDRFETAYNFETDRASLTESERQAFALLFEVVIWFSPFAEEREQIPNYVGPEEVLKAVRDALSRIEGNVGS